MRLMSMLFGLLLAAATATGCGGSQKSEEGPVEEAGETAGEGVEEGFEETGEAIDETGDEMGDAYEETTDELEESGDELDPDDTGEEGPDL